MNDMKRLLSYAGPYKRDMIFGAVLVLVETCFELFIPILISNLIDIGVANGDIPYIYRKGIQMGVCALCALVTGILYAHFAARATYGWGAEIRKAEYEKMQQYAFSNLDHFAVSSLITRMTTDVTVIQNMVSAGFRPITRGPSLLYESAAGICIPCMYPASWLYSLPDCAESCPDVHKTAVHGGPPEQRCPGGADRDPCRQSFRAG